MPSCPGVLDLTRCRWCRVCDVVVGQAFERCTRERCPRCCVPFLATLPCSRATSMCPACFGSCSGVRVVVIVFRVRGLALVRRPAPGEWRGDVSTLVGVCCASAGGYQSRRCSSSMRAVRGGSSRLGCVYCAGELCRFAVSTVHVATRRLCSSFSGHCVCTCVSVCVWACMCCIATAVLAADSTVSSIWCV